MIKRLQKYPKIFIMCLCALIIAVFSDSGIDRFSHPNIALAMPIDSIDEPTLCKPPELRFWGSFARHGLPVLGATIQIDAADAKLIDNDSAGSCGEVTYYSLDPGTFRWELEAPAGSGAVLNGTDTLTPSLTLDVVGSYTVRLVYCTPECQVVLSSGETLHIAPGNKEMSFNAFKELVLPPDTKPLVASAEPAEEPTYFPDVGTKCNSNYSPGVFSPQWVTVNRWSGPEDYELLEGDVFRSQLSRKDSFSNHDSTSNDQNTKVAVDPNHYHLLSTVSEWPFPDDHMMGVEWEKNHFHERVWPTPGDRVSVFGYWILDCEHNGYTEIHPPVGFATHRPRPILIPSDKVFDFNGGKEKNTVGTNVYVPGIVTEIWFNRDSGEITRNCSDTGLHQPGPPTLIPGPYGPVPSWEPDCVPTPYTGGPSDIRRSYTFNIYLPRSPQAMMENLGVSAPPVPLYIEIFNLDGSDAVFDPKIQRVVEVPTAIGASTHLEVTIDLSNFEGDNYSRRIVAGWVYPSPDNWHLNRWRLQVDSISVHDDGDNFWTRFFGDWKFWLNTNNGTKEWTKIFDCTNCVSDQDGMDTVIYSHLLGPAPWRTGEGGVLGPDILLYPDRPDLNLYRDQTMWLNTSGYETDSAGTYDDLNALDLKFKPQADFEGHASNKCKSEWFDSAKQVLFYSGCGDYTLNFRVSSQGTVGNANLSKAAMALYNAYIVRATDDLICSSPDQGNLCILLPPIPERLWHPLDYKMAPGSPPRSIYETPLFEPQGSDSHIFPMLTHEEYKNFIDARYNSPDAVAAVYEELKEEIQVNLKSLTEGEVTEDIRPIIQALPADMATPVVTPPPDTTVDATEAAGARGSASAALAAFLSGGSAIDTVDPAPLRLSPQVASVDVDNDTLFPIGSTPVTFRFQNVGGIIGSATADLNVIDNLPRTLTITKTGTGSGTVTSSPAGIDCGNDCTEPYTPGTVVTLTAIPSAGSVFDGWGGVCNDIGPTCIVTMDAAKTAVASFNLALPDVSVTLVPDSASVPRGGTLGYTVTAKNNTSSTQTFKYWTYVVLPPNNSRYPATGELYGPVNVTLKAGQSKSAHMTHNIPMSAPLGIYAYFGNVGPYPGVWDNDSFQFNVTATLNAPADSGDDWKLMEDGLTK